MLPASCRRIPLSDRGIKIQLTRSIHSTKSSSNQDNTSAGRPTPGSPNLARPDQRSHQINNLDDRTQATNPRLSTSPPTPAAGPFSRQPPSQTNTGLPKRWEGHSPFPLNWPGSRQFTPQPNQAGRPGNFQPPNRRQPSFAPPNAFNQPHQRPPGSGYFPAQGANLSRNPRNPNFFQPPPSPHFASQSPPYYPSPLVQPHPGQMPGPRFQPFQAYPPPPMMKPSETHSYPPPALNPTAPPQSRPGMLSQSAYSSKGFSISPENLSPLPLSPRLKKSSQSTLNMDFDLQDLAGSNALNRFPPNPSEVSQPLMNNSFQSSHQPTEPGPRIGNQHDRYSFRTSQSWANNVPGASSSHPHSTPHSNFVQPRNADRHKNRPGFRGNNNNSANAKRSSDSAFTQRRRGRTMLSPNDEPSLPPPPKTVLNELGEYGKELTPSGVPEMTVRSSSAQLLKAALPEDLLSDYKAIPQLIANSTTPVNLPGLNQVVQFELKYIQASYSSDISWGHGEAGRDQIVNRALHLVTQNPSLKIDQKRQAVSLINFLLMSREERMSSIEQS